MKDGFIRVAAATPQIKPADCDYNAAQIIELIHEGEKADVSMLVFPELCITAYTCGDLFLHSTLLTSAEKALKKIIDCSTNIDSVIIVGLPVKLGSNIYNCAAVLCKGKILGVVPKKHIPNYGEFYEARHFSGGEIEKEIVLCGQKILISNKQIFSCANIDDFIFGVEICEDLWGPIPPSSIYALKGATIIANLSASDEIIGKADYRKLLVSSQSARCVCGYIYADAGAGESSTDMVFAGHNIIAENGTILQESKMFETGLIVTELDVNRLANERIRINSFDETNDGIRIIPFELKKKDIELIRKFAPNPFVPSNQSELALRCREILSLQAQGLATRLKATNLKKIVLGLSGGLDSTLALIVAVKAIEILGLPKSNIFAISLPSSSNSERTQNNSRILAEIFEVKNAEIPIDKAMKQHYKDIGLGESVFNTAYENAQARERTQILMDIANNTDAVMVGTGDLSELALGWTTYGGDHMSMYGVNCSVPKTLVRYLIEYVAKYSEGKAKDVLNDILTTPISPELLPIQDGKIAQKTEEIIGPYELHDFFLYYFIRFGFKPSKIFRLAKTAFFNLYKPEEIIKWLKLFFKRFFSNQFKRSCLPDGPKVGTVTLSPRGDFRMPSDASAAVWLADLDNIK